MNRRTYLASLAALTGSAGCLTAGLSLSDRWEKTVSVSAVERRLPESIENVTEDERPTGLAFDATVTREAITPDATARIALGYTNTGSETLTLNVDPDRPAYVPSVAEDPGVVLLSDAHDPTRRSATCWKPKRDTFGQFPVPNRHPIEPGDTETLEYDVWAAPKQDADCMEPATYRFEPLYGSFALTVRK